MSRLSELLLIELEDDPAFLMVNTAHFGVKYTINPWMTQENPVDFDISQGQWWNLYTELRKRAEIKILNCADPKLPDVVFVANAGSYIPNLSQSNAKHTFFVSKFKHLERQPESDFFMKSCPSTHTTLIFSEGSFEGDGDLLRLRDCLVIGSGFRTDHLWIKALGQEMQELTTLPNVFDSHAIKELQLVDPRFYHLDTCFFYHSYHGSEICWFYPGAFSPESYHRLVKLLAEMFIPYYELSEHEAKQWMGNAVGVGDTIIAHVFSHGLRIILTTHGFQYVETPLSEFHKAGGSAKCLTLRVPKYSEKIVYFSPAL